MSFDQLLQLVSVLKWPVTVLIIVVVVMLTNRKGLKAIVDGLRHRPVSVGGAQLGAEQQSQTALPEAPTPMLALPARTTSAPPVAVTDLFETEDNVYITSVAQLVRNNVATKSFATPEQRDRWLFREGAKLEIRVEFERLYRLLFQSQLNSVIGASNALNTGGAEAALIRRVYDETAKRHPDFYDTYPYESWLGFLTTVTGLLVQNGTRWAVTHKGQLYLHFCTANGYGTRAYQQL